MRTLILAGVLAAATTSLADPPRYTRKPDLRIDVKLSNRVKPVQSSTASPQRAPITADIALAIEVNAQPIRREQEAILVRLVNDTPDDDPEKPDLMLRLAEHYAQQLRFWRLKAIEP